MCGAEIELECSVLNLLGFISSLFFGAQRDSYWRPEALVESTPVLSFKFSPYWFRVILKAHPTGFLAVRDKRVNPVPGRCPPSLRSRKSTMRILLYEPTMMGSVVAPCERCQLVKRRKPFHT